jgi:hypothetical protein
MDQSNRVAVVTGASSGIGAATARRLRAEGFEVYVGARRMDRLRQLASEIGVRAFPLDVCDRRSVETFAAEIPRCDVLVNNAGGALGLEPVREAIEQHWQTMWESNVLGLMLVTRAFLPRLDESGAGHIVNIGSIAGFETYAGGAGYAAAKHAARAVTRTLRLELLGKQIRVTEVNPGLVETEFSLVRFGDAERARKVYEGLTPLTGEDIADCVAWAVSRPWHVNVDEIVVRPVAQATATQIARNAGL